MQDGGANTQIIYIDPNTGRLTFPEQVNLSSIAIGGGAPLCSSNQIQQYIGEMVTSSSDSVILVDSRIKAGAVCSAVPYNQIGANMAGVYAAAGDGIVIVFHPAMAGGGFSIICTGG